jgi:thymidylate kinase
MAQLILGIEGIDGTGKTSVIRFLEQYCRKTGLSCAIQRVDGGPSPFKRPPDLEEVVLKQMYFENIVFDQLAQQYKRAKVLASLYDVIIMERTFISMLMGRLNTYRQQATAQILDQSKSIIRENIKDFFDWDHLWFLWRHPVDIVTGIRAREFNGQQLGSFDKLLLENPDFLVSEQEKFEQVASYYGSVKIINNNSLDELNAQVLSLLQQHLHDR